MLWAVCVVLPLFRRLVLVLDIFFFFKQKTAYEMRISDWSSDVCSSDLLGEQVDVLARDGQQVERPAQQPARQLAVALDAVERVLDPLPGAGGILVLALRTQRQDRHALDVGLLLHADLAGGQTEPGAAGEHKGSATGRSLELPRLR